MGLFLQPHFSLFLPHVVGSVDDLCVYRRDYLIQLLRNGLAGVQHYQQSRYAVVPVDRYARLVRNVDYPLSQFAKSGSHHHRRRNDRGSGSAPGRSRRQVFRSRLARFKQAENVGRVPLYFQRRACEAQRVYRHHQSRRGNCQI